MEDNILIRQANYETDYEAIRFVRHTVFVEEQKVSEELEIDGRDEESIHVLALKNNNLPIGTARMFPDGHLGRIAVLVNHRGEGIGKALVECLCGIAVKKKLSSVDLNAQTHAAEFYRKLGFTEEGGVFFEANMPHIHMIRKLC